VSSHVGRGTFVSRLAATLESKPHITEEADPDAYDPMQNVRPIDWDPTMPVLWALDFNVNPRSSVIAQRQPRPGGLDVINVLDELVIANSDTWSACEAFRERTEKWADVMRRRLKVIVNGDSRKTSGETDYRIIKQFFSRYSDISEAQYKFGQSNPRVRDRVNAVNGMLCRWASPAVPSSALQGASEGFPAGGLSGG
jgi:hypothetical protein